MCFNHDSPIIRNQRKDTKFFVSIAVYKENTVEIVDNI